MAKLVISMNGLTLREYPLDKEQVTLGRNSDNDIVISEGVVSGRHATLTRSEQGVAITDLGSTNGTYVNGRRASKQGLYHNDVITLGNHQLRYVDVGVQDFAATVIIDQASGAPGRGAALRILNGPRAGEVMAITKARTALGKPGLQVAVIMQQGEGYQLLPVEVGGNRVTTRVNGSVLTDQPVALRIGDEIVIADARLELIAQ